MTKKDTAGTVQIDGVVTEALKEGEDVKESLAERILGRVTVNDIVNPLTKKIIVKAGDDITDEKADIISEETPITSVEIRSVLTCESKREYVQNVMEEIYQPEN